MIMKKCARILQKREAKRKKMKNTVEENGKDDSRRRRTDIIDNTLYDDMMTAVMRIHHMKM